MSFSAGTAAFKLAFEISPIILVGGVAKWVPGEMLPIVAISQAASFAQGLLSGGDVADLNNFFAHFKPLSGGTLISQQIGTYPFANQGVAANATIAQPLSVSMLMICPARDELGYAVKLATMIALQTVLAQHATLGGTYTVITPSYFYTNGILTSMRDVTGGETKQPQAEWQMDFAFPLLTLEQAQGAQNSLMSKLTAQTQVTDPAWTGLPSTVGNANSVAAPNVIPSATNLPGAGISPQQAVGSSLPPSGRLGLPNSLQQ